MPISQTLEEFWEQDAKDHNSFGDYLPDDVIVQTAVKEPQLDEHGAYIEAAWCPGSPPDNSCSPANKGEGEGKGDADSKKKVARDEQGHYPPLAKRLQEVETRKAAGSKVENASLIGPYGDVAFEKAGGEDTVQFNTGELAKMRDGILTHNHPKGGTFSRADIQVAIHTDLAEMRAYGLEDDKLVAYSMKRPEDGWPDPQEFADALADNPEYMKMLTSLSDADAGTYEQRKQASHRVYMDISKKLGFDYTRTEL